MANRRREIGPWPQPCQVISLIRIGRITGLPLIGNQLFCKEESGSPPWTEPPPHLPDGQPH